MINQRALDRQALADPVGAHVAALERALRGPARARHSMIREVRGGLHDAVAAHRAGGHDADRAAARAIREFGAVEDVAPLLQAGVLLAGEAAPSA